MALLVHQVVIRGVHLEATAYLVPGCEVLVRLGSGPLAVVLLVAFRQGFQYHRILCLRRLDQVEQLLCGVVRGGATGPLCPVICC